MAVEVAVLKTPLNQIRFRMNPKRYGDDECRSTRAKPSRSARSPHVLGITLCTSRIERTSDSALRPLQHVAYVLGMRCVRSMPPLVVETWNLSNVSTGVMH